MCADPVEKKAVKNLAKKNLSAASAALCSMDSLKDHIFVECTKRVMKEAVIYSKKPNCMLKATSPNAVANLSNSKLFFQLCEECPQLVSFLAAICNSGKPKKGFTSV